MSHILVKRWLVVCCCMVIFMIFLGGLTRLTDAGLSIVEWKPVSGIVPPLGNADWQDEFAKYQQSVEYKQKNTNMTLSEFKFIFWLEFIHRFAGRVTGLLYLVPLLYFFVRGRIDTRLLPVYLAISLLFAVQGFMGWYMVKSGLILQPYVSHFRLACHLVIAVIIYNLLFYQLMKNSFDILLVERSISLNLAKFFCIFTIIIVYIQIFLGGLVAGLDAGLVYNSFPLMGNSFIPQEIAFKLLSRDSLSDAVFVQFIHRIGAYIVCTSVGLLVLSLIKTKHPKLNKVAYYIVGVLILQMLAGIITILYSVPILMALVHQIFAIILLSCILWGYFLLKSS
ncbi:COX15/CtaA family protein [Candidatus Tisiphia endosymbiont of Parasteatoda lunata]|uniref:COX15/CtaA family protein n=1 Tax=Candidatus Tisiphia endosymbiont of Parasteatoda lunata TaxID=3066275 RepID=UPI00313CAD85